MKGKKIWEVCISGYFLKDNVKPNASFMESCEWREDNILISNMQDAQKIADSFSNAKYYVVICEHALTPILKRKIKDIRVFKNYDEFCLGYRSIKVKLPPDIIDYKFGLLVAKNKGIE